MTRSADVPPEILDPIRQVCLGLPEAYEEQAWVGTRWRIRAKTFAHVLAIDTGRPASYASAAGTDGPAIVLMFRSSGPELDLLRDGGPPFFAPVWRADEVGLVVGSAVDWTEVTELLTDSYCIRAPKGLSRQVERPAAS